MRAFGIRHFLLAALMCFGVAVCHARAEQQDNQQYLHWAKFKPGSSVTMTGNVEGNAQKVQIDMTNTLVEVKPDKLVLESYSTLNIAGQDRKSPARKRDVPAKEEKKAVVKEVGEEQIEAAGKKFKCKVIEGETDVAPGPGGASGKAKAKIWIADEVPGGAVKMVVTSDRGTMTFTLKSFDVK